MSFFISILIGFLRLASDNEVTALKGSGLSFFQLLPPVLILSFTGTILTGFAAMVAQPWGEHSLKNLLFQVAVVQAKVSLKERVFYNEFKELVFYIQKVHGDGLLEDVFIYDQREKDLPQTIIAKRGWLIPNHKERSLNLRLEDGHIYNVSLNSKSAQTVFFKSYDLFLPLEEIVSNQEKREKSETEMYLPELREKIRQTSPSEKKYYNYQIEYYRKFSLPFACLVLGLIAFPLGLQSRVAGRSWAMILGRGGLLHLLFVSIPGLQPGGAGGVAAYYWTVVAQHHRRFYRYLSVPHDLSGKRAHLADSPQTGGGLVDRKGKKILTKNI